jgi:Tfp pilus assembly PilM family ATPase
MAAAETGIRKAEIALSVPKAWTVATIAEFPATIRENFQEAMQHELDRLTPFSPDEALHDFKILREAGERITVLVVAAKADIVMPYVDALRCGRRA